MSTQVQRRKGTTAQHASFTGASAELTVDTTKNTVVVHDGATAGGIPLAKETGSALSVTSLTSSGASVISTTDNTNAALRITQLGTGNALLVEDSANPDSSPVVINASGNLIVGNTSTINSPDFGGTQRPFGLSLVGETFASSGLLQASYIASASPQPTNFAKARGSITSPSIVLANDGLMALQANGFDGTNFLRASSITAAVDGTPGTNDMPGRLVFSTTAGGASSPTERMRIDSVGNLGLGVTPSAWVDDKAVQLPQGAISSGYDYGISVTSVCYRTSSNAWLYKVTGQAPTRYHAEGGSFKWYSAPSGTAGGNITFTQAMTLDASGNLLVGTTSANFAAGSGFHLYRSSGTTLRIQDGLTDFDILAFSANVNFTNRSNGALIFGTNNTERARIDSSGNLLVGRTTPFDQAKVAISYDSGLNQGLVIGNTASATADAVRFKVAGSTIGSINTSTTGTLYNTSSDYRLKNITGPITNSGAYIDSLKPVEGTWKADGSTFVGLIAHETQEVSRTTVATGTKDGEQMQGMDYSSAEIIANLIAELQSLRARVAQLESK